MVAVHSMPPDDVIAARSGDTQAFTRLVREHAGPVCAIATAILGSPVAGEEVGQEVFVYAWQELPRLRDPGRFGPWLKQIARNRAHDVLRKRARRRELPDTDTLEQLEAQSAETGDLIDGARQERALWAAFEALEEEDREVLALFYCQEGSVRALALQLELSEPAARKRLSRARSRLRDDVTGALGQQLARTVPGLAFAAAVVAALGPRTAQAAPGAIRPSRGRFVGWSLAGVIGAALLLAWLAPDASSKPRSPEAHAQRTSSRKAVVDLLALGSSEPSESSVAVSVQLGAWGRTDDPAHRQRPFYPVMFWPQPEEGIFPEGGDETALVAYVRTWKPDQPIADEMVETIEALRTAPLPDDPWGALIALEAERLHALRAAAEAQRDFRTRYGLPDPEVDERAYATAREQIPEEDPTLDLSAVLARGREVRDRWPDHRVADYASLYIATSFTTPNAWDPEALRDEVMALAQRTDNPVVRDHAFTLLANVGDEVALGPEAFDLLSRFYARDEIYASRDTLSELAVDTMLAEGDLDRAAIWMPRYDRITEETCAMNAEMIRVVQEALPTLAHLFDPCGPPRAARDSRSSWLAAKGIGEPASWQAALMALARRCEADGHTIEAPLMGEGRFDGAWSWSSWEGNREFSICIATTPHEGPEPPQGTRVRLEVLPKR